jgi:hypothetical protein
MKIYKYNSKHFGFEMPIPDGWSASPMVNLIARLSQVSDSFGSPSGGKSDSRTIVGPNGKYLQIMITPLTESEPEPTIGQMEEYFDGLTNRQNLNVIATGTIQVANKDHFWATYYRGFLITLASGDKCNFSKSTAFI